MKRRITRKTARSAVPPENTIYQLKITLLGSSPPVWRRIRVPGDFLMDDLHEMIQVVMGWQNCHLHQFIFRSGKRMIFVRPEDEDHEPDFGGRTTLDSLEHTLADIATRRKMKIIYEYDFGDSWEHEILVEDILPASPDSPAPRCLDGAGACPPEDCGGVCGYQSLLEALADPSHPEHEEYKEWVEEDFDPGQFDVDEVNQWLARVF
jgi:Plasmid pRiA4b ORF-3-like protein